MQNLELHPVNMRLPSIEVRLTESQRSIEKAIHDSLLDSTDNDQPEVIQIIRDMTEQVRLTAIHEEKPGY